MSDHSSLLSNVVMTGVEIVTRDDRLSRKNLRFFLRYNKRQCTTPTGATRFWRGNMNLIYLDNNATTPLLPTAWEAMRAGFLEAFGNPGSAHRAGRRARQLLEDSRERIAAILGAHADEVVFTSGATEANNLALAGL